MLEKRTYEELENKVHELEDALYERNMLLDHLPDHMIIQDLKQRVIWANRAAANSVGKNLENILGQHCFEIWQQRKEPCEGCPVLETMKTGKAAERETLTPYGRAYHVRGYPLFDREGRIIGAVECGLDITDRKRAESALIESEARFRQIYEHMEIGVARISLEFRIESANAAYCRMLGYHEDELIGKHLRDITHPEFIADNLDKQKQLAAGKIDHFCMEKQYIDKNGKPVYALLNASLIRDIDGKPLYCLGSVADITELKQSTEKLLINEEKFKFLAENMGDIVWTLDMNFDATYVSPSIEKVLGFTPEERKRQKLAEMVTPASMERITAIYLEELQRDVAQDVDPDRSDLVKKKWTLLLSGFSLKATILQILLG